MTILHKDIRPNGNPDAGGHVLHYYTFADVSAMAASTDSLLGSLTLVSADVGKVARVGGSVPYDFYVLVNHTGAGTWTKINGGGGVTDHGSLSGLADDDHLQYLLVDGSRAMYGALSLVSGSQATPGVNFGSGFGWYYTTGTIRASNGLLDMLTLSNTYAQFPGRVISGNGTSSLPSLSFSDNTGWYRPSAGVMGLSLSGSPSWSISSSVLSAPSTGAQIYSQGVLSLASLAGSSTPLPVNDVSNLDISGFTATSLIGALNELKTSTGTIITDHGSLTGLADDDHTQYLLVNGTRAMTGTLTVPTTGVNFASVANNISLNGSSYIQMVVSGSGRVWFAPTAIFSDVPLQFNSSNAVIANGATSDLTLTARGSSIAINESGNTSLAGFSNTSVVGALNELKSTAISDHGLLSGLVDDDHPQYVLTDGSRTMTGALLAPGVDASTGDLTLTGRSTSIPLNESGATSLSGFSATSIVGALQELLTALSGISADHAEITLTNETSTTTTAGDVVTCNVSGEAVISDATNGVQRVVGIVTSGASGGGTSTITTSGKVSGLSGLSAGSRYYLGTAGGITTSPPGGSGDYHIELGFALSATEFLLRVQQGEQVP